MQIQRPPVSTRTLSSIFQIDHLLTTKLRQRLFSSVRIATRIFRRRSPACGESIHSNERSVSKNLANSKEIISTHEIVRIPRELNSRQPTESQKIRNNCRRYLRQETRISTVRSTSGASVVRKERTMSGVLEVSLPRRRPLPPPPPLPPTKTTATRGRTRVCCRRERRTRRCQDLCRPVITSIVFRSTRTTTRHFGRTLLPPPPPSHSVAPLSPPRTTPLPSCAATPTVPAAAAA